MSYLPIIPAPREAGFFHSYGSISDENPRRNEIGVLDEQFTHRIDLL